MRDERITFWKCPECHGVGKLAPHWSDTVSDCPKCDGTGNALVDDEAERLRRRVSQRERNAKEGTQNDEH